MRLFLDNDHQVNAQHHQEGPSPTPQDEDNHLEPNYFIFSITLILVLLVVIGNSITILVFKSTPKLCNQTGFCLINLAIADLLTGVIYLPYSLPCALNGDCLIRTNRYLCLGVVTVSYTCYSVSVFTLVIVMLDRYLQISRPFHYNEIFSKPRTLATLVSSWVVLFTFTAGFILSEPNIIVFDGTIYHCTIAAASRLSWSYTYCVNIFCFLLPVFVICGCSFKIAIIAHRARLRIANQEAAVASSGNSQAQRTRAIRHFRKSEVRIAIRIFVVVAAFIICCMPFNIELLYARRTQHMFPDKAAVTTVLMVEINSALNPIIYVTSYSKFRRVFKAKYLKFCRNSNRGDSVIWTVTSQHRDQYTPSRRRTSPMTMTNTPPNNRMFMMTAKCNIDEEIDECVADLEL
ncbi:trace amine-associated receptor 13c-like [Lytechinus variegatus]|uniref:trace amine-associated receptor 13c-like n=1 Tax=Lytechinus variegatus TaxID=7654 RepID=UPI001BB0FF5A|nr:trace amine-associated receptor 13c-like [Lytechinus variegatus]